jgi:hypothetical protein
MLVAFVILASTACLGLGLFAGQLLFVWIALGLGVAGLTLVAAPTLTLRWRRRIERKSTNAAVIGSAVTMVGDDLESDTSDSAVVDSEPCSAPSVDPRSDVAAEVNVDAGVGADGTLASDPVGAENGKGASDHGSARTAIVSAQPVGPFGAGHTQPEGEGRAKETTVLVVQGRRRFHRIGCRLLADRKPEEIELEEALDEGYTACTVCVPDRAILHGSSMYPVLPIPAVTPPLL